MHIFLETGRLVLRALNDDPEVMRFINGGRPASAETIREYTLPLFLRDYPGTRTRGYWAAQEKATGALLGWFEFRPLDEHSWAEVELGYRLRKNTWGRGYATEGSRALLDKGFTELGVERVIAHTMAVNAGPRRVMEKSGLSFLRNFTGNWPEPTPGSEHGDVEYELTRTQWEQHR